MYTPRPKRLLVDGDVYKMDFERDEAAYEDYQELLGRTAGRNVNTKYNEYVDKKMAMEMECADASSLQDEEQEIKELIEHLPEVSEQELFHTLRKMEEGFYSDEGVRRLEQAIRGEAEMEQMRIATQMMRRMQIRKEPRKMSRIQNWNVMQKNQAKTKKNDRQIGWKL